MTKIEDNAWRKRPRSVSTSEPMRCKEETLITTPSDTATADSQCRSVMTNNNYTLIALIFMMQASSCLMKECLYSLVEYYRQ